MSDPTTPGATPASGATPAAPAAGSSGTTDTPTTPATTPAATPTTTPAATAGDDGLGDAGKRAIQAERERAKAAEKERDDFKRRLEELENAGKSEHEKAIAAARKEAATEATTAAETRIRRAEIRRALTAAGIQATELELAARADEFGSLKVADNGDLEGIDDAVEAFKKSHPTLFATKGPAGSIDQGARGKPGLTLEAIKAMPANEINERWDEVQQVLSAQKR